MKKEPFENKLEQAAKNGDAKKIKELLNQPDAVQVISSLGAFQPEEAAFFIRQSIHKAQQSCTEGGILMKRKISIPILVAVICILCTVGVYAGNRFTHKFFIKNGVVQYEVTRVDLTPEEKEALNRPTSKKIKESISYTSYAKIMKSPEKVKEAVGIYPLVPAYLPDDFDTIIYQVICWNVGKNSVSDSYDTYSPASYPHTILYGTGNRSIIIDERILEKDTLSSTSTRSTAYVKNSGIFTSKTGIDYAFYESKRSKGVDVEYVSIQDNKITTIFFDGLSQEEIEDVLNSIE